MTDDAAIRRCVSVAVARLRGEPGPLLEILHSVQNEFGCLPAEAVPLIASALNLSRAEVHGVVSFYHHFRERPAGLGTLKLCRAEACQSMGADALADFTRRRLGIDFGQTTADGRVTLEAVYCLGLCACAPSAMWNGDVIGRITPRRIDEIAEGAGPPA